MENTMSGASCVDLTPVTEQSNAITAAIDVASAEDIVRLIARADEQIFDTSFEGLLSTRCTETMDEIAQLAAEMLQDSQKKCKIVLSGCGTSGRIGFTVAKSFNESLQRMGREEIFEYIMAGTDRALFVSQELAEDSPITGQQDLEKVSVGCDRVLYIGITCGLSAPYIAGQLDLCLNNFTKYVPVIIGFNHLSMARTNTIENWDKTFFEVATRLSGYESNKHGFILNPIIGPEPITGSTRMKSGSATKILLECIFAAALHRLHHVDINQPISSLLTSYQTVQQLVYSDADNLGRLIEFSGASVKCNAHIYYVSGEKIGITGLIDASECTPTYGCDRDDVRGFVLGGYQTLGNNDGDLSNFQEISLNHFKSCVIPSLTENDLIVFIVRETTNWITDDLLTCTSRKCLLQFLYDSDSYYLANQQLLSHMNWNNVFRLRTLVPDGTRQVPDNFLRELLLEFACKLTCNLLTTGAYILGGKICQNYMVDLRVSNNKLFHRAVSIVAKFGACTNDEAHLNLLRSLYNTDSLTQSQIDAPVSMHIIEAADQYKVVPVAITMARLQCSVGYARTVLKNCPVIRLAISSQLVP